jgi:aspartate kinase
MKIYKFGGASVKNASAVKNLAKIVNQFDDPLVIVVSAMGKTTRALEKLVEVYFNQESSVHNCIDEIYNSHMQIVEELFPEGHIAYNEIDAIFDELKSKLATNPSSTFNFEYDQIVSYGEIISTTIVNLYLNNFGILSEWVDIRKIIITDANYREARLILRCQRRMPGHILTIKI